MISLFTYEPGPQDSPEPHLVEYYVRDFDELTQYFSDIYKSYAVVVAEHDSADNGELGGFEVELKKPDGATLRVCVGDERWLLFDDSDQSGFVTDGFGSSRELIFYLEAWYWTSFCEFDTISRENCLQYVREWLADDDKEQAEPRNAREIAE